MTILRILFWILLTATLIIFLFVFSNPAKAHENGLWKDAGATGQMYGYKRCGMGYYLAGNADGSQRALLLAGLHWHELGINFDADVTCKEFMRLLKERSNGYD